MTSSHLHQTGLGTGREQRGQPVGLVPEQSRVGHAPAAAQFARHRCEHRRRGDPSRDQCRHPSQRGLLLGKHAEFVAAGLDHVLRLR